MSDGKVVLSLDKVAAMLPVGLQQVELIESESFLRDELVYRLSGFVLSEHLAADTQTDSREFPASWWDHAKLSAADWAAGHRHLGRPVRWFVVKKRPPRMKRVEFSVTWHRAATRPHSTIKVPDQLGPVVYQERVETWWSDF